MYLRYALHVACAECSNENIFLLVITGYIVFSFYLRYGLVEKLG